jgi:tetratricopeptide (TPR) repeat protein
MSEECARLARVVSPSRPLARQLPLTAPGKELKLPLKCNDCGRVSTYEVGHVVAHPQPEQCRAEGWDGVLLGRVIVCKRCRAEDDYQLTGEANMTLSAQMLVLCATRDNPAEGPALTLGAACLWDGTIVRRPSQGLAALRASVARESERAEPWRRLGNFARRYGRMEEAERAFRKSVELDEREVEAAHSLAEMCWNARRFREAAPLLGLTIERLRDGDAAAELRQAMSRSTLEMLRAGLDMDPTPIALMAVWEQGTTSGTPVVGLSSVDLRELSDAAWDRLAEFLLDKRLIKAGLTLDMPEPGEHTQLAALLCRRESSVMAVRPYTPPPPGRNRPCPCGSGKKRKLCCGP